MPAPNRKINAIFFDLDGTLHFNVPSERVFFGDCVAALGVPITQQDRERAGRWEYLYWAESDDMLADQAAFPEAEAFWPNYVRRQLLVLGCSPEQAGELLPRLMEYMQAHYKPETQIEPATAALLADFRAAGYLLGVISNRGQPFDEELERHGIKGFFDIIVSGGEAGTRKPDPGIFKYALERAGVEASESIYVGDNYFADVVGARNAQILPVLIDRDRIFDDPGCPVINSLTELPAVLENI